MLSISIAQPQLTDVFEENTYVDVSSGTSVRSDLSNFPANCFVIEMTADGHQGWLEDIVLVMPLYLMSTHPVEKK